MIELLFICCLIIICGLFLVKNLLFYSEDKPMKELFDKLPQIKPHWFYGNSSSDDIYKALKGVRLGVWYTGRKRQLFVMDPDLIHKIVVTDFDHFVDSAFLDPEYSKAMGNQLGIVEATGDTWKTLKKLASGPFSLIRLKKSISLFNECYKHMLEYIEKELSSGNSVIEGANILPQITSDILAVVGLGLNLNSFQDPQNEFKKHLDGIWDSKRWEGVEMLPKLAKLFRVKAFNPESVKFVETIIKRTMDQRALGGDYGKDILGSLLKIKEENSGAKNFEVILNTYIQFMTDGNGVAADLLGATLYYIIAHPEIYSKLVEEQDAVFSNDDAGKNGDISEEEVGQLEYLDMVIAETCRLCCIDKTPRVCTKSWKIPNSDTFIPAGTQILMPISAIHRDPDIWESPEEFNPERFSKENKSKIKNGSYLPFGTGPRQCLGNNYIKLHIKLTITHLLRNYDLENFENLPKVMERAHAFTFLPESGIRLKLEKR